MLRALFHLAGIILFGFSIYWEFWRVQVPPHLQERLKQIYTWPGKWKYLTIWNLTLLFIFQILSLINDLVGSNTLERLKQRPTQRLRDAWFACMIFPVGAFVSISFWGLYTVDRKLVFPVFMDEFIPSWLNHAVHTGPIVFLLLETLFTPKIFPRRWISIRANVAFTIVYLSWISWVAYLTGIWVYPVLQILSFPMRIVFLSGSTVLFIILYFLAETLHRLRWSDEAMTFKASVDLPGGGHRSTRKTK